jgi:hypothetical protein
MSGLAKMPTCACALPVSIEVTVPIQNNFLFSYFFCFFVWAYYLINLLLF